jgi:uncharacterized membrane protein YkgB
LNDATNELQMVAKKGVHVTFIVRALIKLGILKNDIDYHLLRASMVIVFLFFGYQKWFEYEAQALLPYIGHGPLISWMYPVFGVRGATYFLGVAEWLFGALLFAGYWNNRLGIVGALGSSFTFIATSTIIPFMPDGWAASAGGFPAMTEKVAFLMKDLVLFAVSVYLLRQDLIRASLFKTLASDSRITVHQNATPTGVAAGSDKDFAPLLLEGPSVVEQLITAVFQMDSAKEGRLH